MRSIVFVFLFFQFVTPLVQSQDVNKMIVARMEVRPELVDSVICWAGELLIKTPKEKGCVSYNLYRGVKNPDELVFIEVYQNQSAMEEHFKQPYLSVFREKRDPCLKSKPQVTITDIGE